MICHNARRNAFNIRLAMTWWRENVMITRWTTMNLPFNRHPLKRRLLFSFVWILSAITFFSQTMLNSSCFSPLKIERRLEVSRCNMLAILFCSWFCYGFLMKNFQTDKLIHKSSVPFGQNWNVSKIKENFNLGKKIYRTSM